MITKDLLSEGRRFDYDDTLLRYGLSEEWGEEALQAYTLEHWNEKGFGVFSNEGFQARINVNLRMKEQKEKMDAVLEQIGETKWKYRPSIGNTNYVLAVNELDMEMIIGREHYLNLRTDLKAGGAKKDGPHCLLLPNGKKLYIMPNKIVNIEYVELLNNGHDWRKDLEAEVL